jgi:hypothetical protein
VKFSASIYSSSSFICGHEPANGFKSDDSARAYTFVDLSLLAGHDRRQLYPDYVPLVLIPGAVLSMRVAAIYKNWLRNAFIFLSLFLFLMIFPYFDFLWNFYSAHPQLVVLLQWITYAMLVFCSFYILKVTEVREINRKGWVLIGAAFLIGIIILAYHVPQLYHNYPHVY